MTHIQAPLAEPLYPARVGRLPRHLDEITPRWLTGLLDNRYPGILVHDFETVEVRNGHTTKLRLALELNDVGIAAGIPRHVCLKSNWSEGFESGEICEFEARFYHFMHGRLQTPVADSYFSDWDGEGGGRGVVMMEDLTLAPGEFGNSTHHLGVDGVAKGQESLAMLHAALWNSPQLKAQNWLAASMAHPVDYDQFLRMYNYMRLNLRKAQYQAILPQWTPAAISLLGDYFEPARRGTVLALYSVGVCLGAGASLMIGGSIVTAWQNAYGENGVNGVAAPFGLSGWQAAFVGVGLPGLLFALVVILTIREPVRGRLDAAPAKPTPHPFRHAMRDLAAMFPPWSWMRLRANQAAPIRIPA